MATNKTYSNHVEDIKEWLAGTAKNLVSAPDQRTWCVLGLTSPLDSTSIETYFDNTDVNKEYKDEYAKGVITNIPIAYNQVESDHIQGLAKMYVYRHQPRLKSYRDDCEHKDVRTYSALSLSLAKLDYLKKLT